MPISLSVGDLFEIKLTGNYGGQAETNNIFAYQVTSLGSGAGAPADLYHFLWGWFETVKNTLLGLTSVEMTYTNLEGRLLDSTTGAFINSVSLPITGDLGDGGVSGEALPPADAWTFKYLRPDATFRHGFKRFAGVPESDQANGVPTSGALTGLTAFAALLATPLPAYTAIGETPSETLISGSAAKPVVIQRIKNGDILNPIGIASITTVQFDKIGHQDTRDFGRGV